jgi:hypothetical protein
MNAGTPILAAAIVLALNGGARGDERPRIVVLDDSGQPVLTERIRAELTTMGFDAAVVTLPASDNTLTGLRALTRERASVAAIRVVLDADGAEAMLFDRATGKRLQRHIEGGVEQEARLALLAVELLRASLLELALPDAPRGDLAASAALLEAARVPPRASPTVPLAAHDPAPPIVGIEVGLGALASRGGMPSNLALALSASALLGTALHVGLFALVPMNAMTIRATEGSSTTNITIVGGELRHQTLGRGWHAAIGGGAALSVFTTEGRGEAPLYRDSSATRFSGGPFLRASIGYALTRTFALRVGATAGALLRPFALEFADREVARWGVPWLSAWAATEVRLP